jgi:hypothetical protein
MARIHSAGALLLTGISAALGSLNAQTCSGTQDFSGPFVFTAVRLAYVPQATNPPGSTTASTPANPIFVPQATAAPGTTGQYSMTPIGQLVGWSSNASPFSGVGRILADGAGVIYASNKADEAGFTRVGTYTVALDCTISITLNDAFTTAGGTGASTGTATTQTPAVTFQGVLTDRGNEATLVQNTQGSGVLIHFVRPFLAFGCSNASLGGSYGLSGLGVDLTPASTGTGTGTTTSSITPLTFALLFTADGAGVIRNPLGTSGYTGTYSVKSDCTGTLSLVSPDKSTTRKVAFVLTNSNNTPGQLPRASVMFVLDDPGKFAGFGEAR